MKLPLVLSAVLLIAACGADGEPVRPTATTNINVNPNGVNVGTNVRVGKGPFAVNLGLGL